MQHLKTQAQHLSSNTALYKKSGRFFCVLGCYDLPIDANAEDMKRHYVEHHGALELCLWGIDKHSLMLEVGIPVKHLKVEHRMTNIREMLSLIGKDCDVIDSAQGTSMIVPRRSKNLNR